MRNIKITIEYDGTNFHGWQIQAKGHRTVQGEIRQALKKIFKRDTIIIGSGRTDTGVHAVGQVANFKIQTSLPVEKIRDALNGNLPEDIAILKAEEVPGKFNAQFSAKRKTYRYALLNRRARCVHNRLFCYHFNHKLNLAAMRKAARSLTGKKDFRSFTATDSARGEKKNDTVRTIHALKINKKDDYIFIDITANGFLYKMVRNIVGALLEVGTGRLTPPALKKILKARNRNLAPATAPAHGLCLLNVDYF